jgi:hypothetical protein
MTTKKPRRLTLTTAEPLTAVQLAGTLSFGLGHLGKMGRLAGSEQPGMDGPDSFLFGHWADLVKRGETLGTTVPS